MRRSLILAGGGLKAAYQAGCLQVILDEATSDGEKLRFHHIDAASAGCFNAAMICSGKSGTEIADAWRTTDPRDLISFDLAELKKFVFARSFATLEGVRNKAFVDWGLDFEKIRSFGDSEVTFNYFNFTQKQLTTVDQKKLDADLLCACVALPMWFAPVMRDGDALIDAVYATDACLENAVQRNATELWAIWTVGKRTRYRNGFIAQYFHMLEQAADSHFFPQWTALAASSKHLIRQEVPLHYLLNVSRERMVAAVELGISDARTYCRSNGFLSTVYPVTPPPPVPVGQGTANVTFSETMRGFYFAPIDGTLETFPLTLRLKVDTGNIDLFIQSSARSGYIEGAIDAPHLGGTLDVTTGTFELFVDERDEDNVIIPGNKRMKYTLRFRSPSLGPMELRGVKYAVDGPGMDLWRDTTTLYVQLVVLKSDGSRVPYGAGIVTLGAFDLLKELLSLRGSATDGPLGGIKAVARFVRLFVRQCWDVYARDLLDYAPF